jgi:malonyl CoA-acyl carrier protein transacylase/SAM-dependent methyltransferase
LSLSDGLRVIAARGRLMQSLPADGEMVALFTDEATVAGAVESRSDDVGIAAVNGPFTTVISGRRGAVQEVIDELALDDDDLRRLDVSVAAHSPLVEPILDDFAATVAGVELSAPQIGLVSSMTGRFVVGEPTEVGYWRRHLRQPVRFADVFDTLREAGCTTFVEIGPHPTLLGLGRRAWPDSAASWIPSMQRGSDELAQIAHSAASVYAAGHAIDWRSFDRHGRDDPPARRKVPLPTYPWQRSSYWSPAAAQAGPAPAAPMWAAAAAAAALQADSGPLDLDVDSYPQRFELLERLAGAYIARAFRSMGLFTQAGEAHRVDELFDAGHIGETAMPFAEGYEHLAGRWLEHLVDDGLLTTDGDRFVSSTPLPDVDVESIVAEAEIAFEGIEPLLDYVMRCGDDLDAVVTGRETALNTLFPEGSYETVDFVYGGWAIPRYFNAIVRAAATAAANARPGRPLRVLEIGAGTGGTTAAVLPALPADRTSYTFTDVSDFFLARAAERFAAHPTVSYALLDIEDPPAAQGFEPASYDIVVAANVLHATKNLDVTLRHVHSLLAPGGVLLAYEGTHHPRWFDVTTGLIEG